MAEPSTFVKIDRNISSWRWYKDANTLRVFLHLILKANYEPHDFCSIEVKRGQLVTSIKSLASDLSLSDRNIRTALSHLKSTGEVTIKTTSKYSVITIVNYDSYQGKRQTKRQADDKQMTNNRQQLKKDKKIRKEETAPASSLTDEAKRKKIEELRNL